jgi:hypothetical protein
MRRCNCLNQRKTIFIKKILKTIYKWFSELKPITHIEGIIPVNKKDMDAMRKRMRELQMENEILK